MVIRMKNVAIWGTGLIGQSWYWTARNTVTIECFFTNDEEKFGEKLFGIPIKKWTYEQNIFIVIASQNWEEIAVQLRNSGKKPFVDFMPSDAYIFNLKSMNYRKVYQLCALMGDKSEIQFHRNAILKDKKLAVIYGNCQTSFYERLLSLCTPFCEDYIVVKTEGVCSYSDAEDYWENLLHNTCFWENVDLFIYQSVEETNRFSPQVATNYILERLRSDCQCVNIVNIFFDGYFPQLTNNASNSLYISQIPLFWYGDRYVDCLLDKNLPLREILSIVKHENFISQEEIYQKIETSFAELERRECNKDIKIADYLRGNYKKRQLFYSPNHPCNEVLIEYTRRVLQHLGYKWEPLSEADLSLQCKSLKGQDIPVYPSVIQLLELKQYERCFYPNRYISGLQKMSLTFDEFISLYIQTKSV